MNIRTHHRPSPLIVAGFVLTGYLGTAGALPAQLRCTQPTLGPAKVFGGKPLEVSFELVNAGNETIEILGVERSCGCLTPNLPARTLLPGARTPLSFGIRTLGHAEGPHTWRAGVHHRVGTENRILPLKVQVEIVNEVSVRPSVLALHVGDRLVQSIAVEDRRARPLRITRIDPGHSGVAHRMRDAGPGKHVIELDVRAAKLPPGKTETLFCLYTDDPDYPTLAIPLTLVREDRARVSALPEVVRLHREGSRSLLVRLRPRDDRPVRIKSAATSHPGLECSWASGPGPLATVRVRLRDGAIVRGAQEVRFELEDGPFLLPVQIE